MPTRNTYKMFCIGIAVIMSAFGVVACTTAYDACSNSRNMSCMSADEINKELSRETPY